MSKTILTLLMATLMGAGMQAQAAGRQVTKPGIHKEVWRRPDGAPIHFALSIPKGYTDATPVPLVLALHFTANPAGAGLSLLNLLVDPALTDLGAIIIAPDSQGGSWDTPENDKAVIELMDTIIESFNIDTKKVIVTGYSMGGRGTWYFASKYPDRFSAAIPMAGTPPPSADGWRVPVLAIHSKQDEVAAFAPTEARIKELQKKGVRAELITVTGITHFETERFAEYLEKAIPWLKETWK